MFQPHLPTDTRRWAVVALSIALALEVLRQVALGGGWRAALFPLQAGEKHRAWYRQAW
jgi:hypothetical protein